VTEPEIVTPKDRRAWRRWLERHHAQPNGVWLLIRKKGSTQAGVDYEDAVQEALCYGWIDSKAVAHDDDHYRQWMSPRKPTSGWSASNKRRVADLIERGSMAPPGLAAVEEAKRNGSWDKLDATQTLDIPPDLAKAFRAHPPARKHWNAFPPGVRKQILAWIGSAKRPETRARRIDQTARLAAENVRANQ
jgi:uncharacterized protein YdeI (YjbR/CyaY-like superfamily)